MPPFTPIPIISTPQASTSGQYHSRAGYSQDLQEIKNSQQTSMQEMTSLLQTLTKEVTNLKKQNQGIRPSFQQQGQGPNQQGGYQGQPYQQNRPPYQGGYQGQRQNFNQRPFQPYNPAPLHSANPVRDIVPSQNNVAMESEWCFPCNQPHN